eukprot:58074_1
MSSLDPDATEYIPNSNAALLSWNDTSLDIRLLTVKTAMTNMEQNLNMLLPQLNVIVNNITTSSRWMYLNPTPLQTSYYNQLVSQKNQIDTQIAFCQTEYQQLCLMHQNLIVQQQQQLVECMSTASSWTELPSITLPRVAITFNEPEIQGDVVSSKTYESNAMRLEINKLLFDDIGDILYILCHGTAYKYHTNTKHYEVLKCPQPLFSTSVCNFLPHTENKKLVVLDSNSFVHDYIYIYDISTNQIEFKNIISLPTRLSSGYGYHMAIASVGQQHKTLSQMQLVYVINHLYDAEAFGFIPMDVIQSIALYYFTVFCHFVSGKYYCTLEISSIYNSLRFIRNEVTTKNTYHPYFNSIQGGQYADNLRNESCCVQCELQFQNTSAMHIIDNNMILFDAKNGTHVVNTENCTERASGPLDWVIRKNKVTQVVNVNGDYFVSFADGIAVCSIDDITELRWEKPGIEWPAMAHGPGRVFKAVMVHDDIHIISGSPFQHFSLPIKDIINNAY